MWHFNALGLRTKARLHVNKERTPSHLAVSRLTQFNGLDILLFLSLHIMLVLNNEWNFPSNVRLKAIDIQDDVAWKALHVYYICIAMNVGVGVRELHEIAFMRCDTFIIAWYEFHALQ